MTPDHILMLFSSIVSLQLYANCGRCCEKLFIKTVTSGRRANLWKCEDLSRVVGRISTALVAVVKVAFCIATKNEILVVDVSVFPSADQCDIALW
jgi:hypothetical protein